MSETIINVTITEATSIDLTIEETPINVSFIGGGSGDMLKSVYDTNYNNMVDYAENVSNGIINVSAIEIHNHINNEVIHREIVYDADYRSFLIEYS